MIQQSIDTPMQQEDQQLLSRLNTGDQHAYRLLFDRYYPYLISTILQISGNMDLARDVSQEVFFNIWKNRESLNVTSSLKAYLRRAAVNRMLNQIKAQRLQLFEPENLPETSDGQKSVQQELEAEDLAAIIQQSIAQLPEKCRMVFLLCRVEGMSHKEVSEKLSISPKTIENQMTKALKHLRKAIQPYTSKDLLSWTIFLTAIGDWSNWIV